MVAAPTIEIAIGKKMSDFVTLRRESPSLAVVILATGWTVDSAARLRRARAIGADLAVDGLIDHRALIAAIQDLLDP